MIWVCDIILYGLIAAFACLFAAGVVGDRSIHVRTNPPLHTSEPVPFCKSKMRLGMPEMGPGRAIVSFEHCTEGKRERHV